MRKDGEKKGFQIRKVVGRLRKLCLWACAAGAVQKVGKSLTKMSLFGKKERLFVAPIVQKGEVGSC